MRFSTDELAGLEGKIAAAADRALALEQEIFAQLATACLAEADALSRLAAALAELDVTAGLADVAVIERFVRPEIDDSRSFVIEGGRHPVVEQALKGARSGVFIENDCVLGRPLLPARIEPATQNNIPGFDEGASGRLWIVTNDEHVNFRLVSAAVVGGNLLADVLHRLLDPRLRET